MRATRLRCLLATLVLLTGASPARDAVQLIGMLHEPSVSEISGAAVSQRNPAYLFAVNDSQNSPVLHVLARSGGVVGTTQVNGVVNRDWEDLAAFTLDGQPYLLIADTGDNGGLRSSLQLLVVAEPAVPAPPTVDVAWRIAFRLPEGARDIEAVSVDVAESAIYLIAKRHVPRVLYRLPLRPAEDAGVLVAERIGTFNTLPPASNAEKNRDPKFGRFRGDVTSLALDPGGHYALVLSYRDLYLYRRADGASWLQALSGKPRRLHVPLLPQAESVALDARAGDAIVLSEGLFAPIYRVAIH